MDDQLIMPDPRPSRSDAVKNRELLLETARQLFATQGVEPVSMSAIAEAAGVGKGTLYRHFENKAELCQALLDEDQRNLQERTLSQLRSAYDDPAGNLRWFLLEVLAFVERNAALLCPGGGQVSMAVTLGHPAHRWWRQTIRGLLQQINPTMNLEYATDVLYVMLDVHVIHFQSQTLGYDSGYIADSLTEAMNRLIS
jgi:AcrR family transcriptional regulator